MADNQPLTAKAIPCPDCGAWCYLLKNTESGKTGLVNTIENQCYVVVSSDGETLTGFPGPDVYVAHSLTCPKGGGKHAKS